MKQYNTSSKSKTRRQSVINRLSQQLVDGYKMAKGRLHVTEPLKDTDIIRIKKELITLKSRV